MKKFKVPKEILEIAVKLKKAGNKAYLVGGCVRDLILGKKPKDWDLTTDAEPEKIEKLFFKTFYENDFGTVTVVNEHVEDPTLQNVEITPFRLEAKYSNKRHPDSVSFSKNLEDDLKRRDFTMNAIALDGETGEIVDPYDGQSDIENKIIKCVGKAEDRFAEDALRIMRAIRLAAELGFEIEEATKTAINKGVSHLKDIAIERIQVEFTRIIMSPNPMEGMEQLRNAGALEYVLRETLAGIDCKQNGDHMYDVWEHSLRSLQHGADKDFPFHVRLAALLHDIGKPPTRRFDEKKKDYTFYGHDVVGGRIAREMLKRLKYSNKIVEVATKLVRYHLFFSDTDKITLSAVRRIVARVGPENVWDLMKVRACDRIGMGRPKESPYRLRKYHSMIEEAMRSPISVSMLKIDGNRLMEIGVPEGPKIGFVLHALLEEVLDDPEKNTSEYLEKRSKELLKLPDKELEKLGVAGKDKKDEEEGREVREIRGKYGVN